jgi:hypothetical protein
MPSLATPVPCRKKLEEAEGEPCRLLVSDLATDGPQSLYLIQRWLPLMLAIRGDASANAVLYMPLCPLCMHMRFLMIHVPGSRERARVPAGSAATEREGLQHAGAVRIADPLQPYAGLGDHHDSHQGTRHDPA